MATAVRRRFRISVRGLMIVIALVALFTAPIVWMKRVIEHQRVMALQQELLARDAQRRAVRMLELQAAQAALAQQQAVLGADAANGGQSKLNSESELERLKLENDRLRRRVEELEASQKGKGEASEKGSDPA